MIAPSATTGRTIERRRAAAGLDREANSDLQVTNRTFHGRLLESERGWVGNAK